MAHWFVSQVHYTVKGFIYAGTYTGFFIALVRYIGLVILYKTSLCSSAIILILLRIWFSILYNIVERIRLLVVRVKAGIVLT